jgi:hypothetical protein
MQGNKIKIAKFFLPINAEQCVEKKRRGDKPN